MKTKLLFLTLVMLAASGALFAQNSATGNITATSTNCTSVPSSCVWESVLPPNASTTTINISGTFVATLLVEESNNGGTTWTTANTLSAAGTTTYSTNGFTDIRVRCSAFTSGSAAVTISTGLLQVQSVVSGGSSSSASSPYNEINATASPFNVKGDGKVTVNATITNTSAVVTCTDCSFSSADVTKAVKGSNNVGYGTMTFPAGTTILSVQSATQATMSAAATASGTFFYWGTDQAAGMTAAFAALHAQPRCGAIRLPAGYITVTANFYGVNPATCNTGGNVDWAGEDVGGMGTGGTYIVPMQGFTGTMFTTLGQTIWHDFHVFCLGDTTIGTIFSLNADSHLINTKVESCGSTASNALTLGAQNQVVELMNTFWQYTGALNLGNGTNDVRLFNTYSNSAILIGGSATQIYDYSPHYFQFQNALGSAAGFVDNSHGGTYVCRGGTIATNTNGIVNLRVGAGSTTILDNCAVGQAGGTGYGIFWDTGGGNVYSRNVSVISGGSNGALNNVSNNTPANFFDDGTTAFGASIANFTGSSNSRYLSGSQVAAFPQTSETGNVGATTLFTAPANGVTQYRLTYDMFIATAGTSGTIALNLICNNGTATFTQPGAQTLSVTATAGTEASGSVACTSAASSAIQWSTTGIVTPGTLSYKLKLGLEPI